MRAAFKEWAVVVDALGRGEQILILRKGGIREACGGFMLEHEAFLLFPTRFHQQREGVVPPAAARFNDMTTLPADRVRLEFVAQVVESRQLESLAHAEGLRGQHIWQDGIIADRFGRGAKMLHALAVRVCRLAHPVELPVRSHYGGCKSWVELETDVATEGALPVLPDKEFGGKLTQFRSALDLVAAAA